MEVEAINLKKQNGSYQHSKHLTLVFKYRYDDTNIF